MLLPILTATTGVAHAQMQTQAQAHPLDPATEPSTTRWLRALAYLKGKQNNGYARPIEGVVALVNLNATAFDPAELHAAGPYPNQGAPGNGLPAWTQANRSLERQDVVAWYTFGLTHVPRPEEWPVMSASTAGFKLLPVAFFSRNPALDVPK